MNETRATSWRTLDLCACAAFVLFLLAPAVAFSIHPSIAAVNMSENRRSAEFPTLPKTALDWAAWPRAFEAWHDDHFGLRTMLVRAHNLLMVFGLDSDPSARIVVGREHWLYNSGSGIDSWRGAEPFSDAQLEVWRRSLESRQREFEKRGIAYYFAIAPSKAEIYPEFLPKRYRKGGPSRTDQLVAYLAKNSSFSVLDLRSTLLEEKTRDAGDDYTYFPLGTHWNERGAIAASRPILREFAKLWPAVAGIDDSIENSRITADTGDSLAVNLYLPDVLRQQVRIVNFRELPQRALKITRDDERREVTTDQADPSLPRALIFHDSFGLALPGILGRHLSHAHFVWRPDIDLALVESEKPDIVLQIQNDRVLMLPQPQELNAEDDARVQREYQASRDLALMLDVGSNTPRILCFAGGRVSVRGEGQAARVVCSSDTLSDTFLLPPFAGRAGMHPIVHLEFDSSVASESSFFFQTKSDQSYSRKRQMQYETHIGRNELFVEILEPELVGRLMFRPAQEPGTFLISALEVRYVAD